jgi:hypothetical protein
MAMYKALAGSPAIPWRVRQGVERWVESSCRERHPGLYRWLHFGSATDPLRAVTRGPRHHFFGYYDKSPWNASGTCLLAHEAGFNDRPPGPDDQVAVGVVRVGGDDRFLPVGHSLAWNWQQGAMLQWHPADPERLLLHNDRHGGRFEAVVRDLSGKEVTRYSRPVYAMAPDGRHAYSVNFARLQTRRPGYGYAGIEDRWAHEPHPPDDGLHRLDLGSGKSELVVPLDALAAAAGEGLRDAFQWINHVQVSPSGRKVAFFHIARLGDAGWRARLMVCADDGADARCVLDAGFVSHYDWQDDDRILIWAREDGAPGHFWLVDVGSAARRIIGGGVLAEDGHATFAPDRRWLLNDTYPDRHDMRTLMLYRWPDGPRVDLARLWSPKSRWWGEIRCDLHPRWSRDGTKVCIDSVHSGERQMYVLDVAEFLK